MGAFDYVDFQFNLSHAGAERLRVYSRARQRTVSRRPPSALIKTWMPPKKCMEGVHFKLSLLLIPQE
jgi:hypothetical protein